MCGVPSCGVHVRSTVMWSPAVGLIHLRGSFSVFIRAVRLVLAQASVLGGDNAACARGDILCCIEGLMALFLLVAQKQQRAFWSVPARGGRLPFVRLPRQMQEPSPTRRRSRPQMQRWCEQPPSSSRREMPRPLPPRSGSWPQMQRYCKTPR